MDGSWQQVVADWPKEPRESAAYQRGEKPPYTQAFQFEVQRSGTGDRDAPTSAQA